MFENKPSTLDLYIYISLLLYLILGLKCSQAPLYDNIVYSVQGGVQGVSEYTSHSSNNLSCTDCLIYDLYTKTYMKNVDDFLLKLNEK